MDMTGMKHEIEVLTEADREEFEAVSACIFEHPELAFQERGQQNGMMQLLERHGFSVNGEQVPWIRPLWRNITVESREDLCIFM